MSVLDAAVCECGDHCQADGAICVTCALEMRARLERAESGWNKASKSLRDAATENESLRVQVKEARSRCDTLGIGIEEIAAVCADGEVDDEELRELAEEICKRLNTSAYGDWADEIVALQTQLDAAQSRAESGVPRGHERNDPCSCGSGINHKRCKHTAPTQE